MFGSRKLRHLQQGYVNLGRWASVFRRSRSGLYINFAERASLDPRIAFDRDTSAWYFNSAGTLTSASSDVARFDYNPSTLAALGLLEEQASTNSVRNAVMAGASAGTPGTVPTNWIITDGGGVTREIVGTGTENGIPYIDVRLSAASAINSFILPDGVAQIAAAEGEVWNGSFYLKLVGGSFSGISSAKVGVNAYAASVYINETSTSFTVTSAGLATQRIQTTHTMPALTTSVLVVISLIASGAYDITLRVGVPQQEQKAIATSPILSAGSATTRNLDRFTISTLTPWFNAAGGTIVARYALGLPASGSNQTIARFSDNTYDNTIALNVTTGGPAEISTASGGVYNGSAAALTTPSADTFTTVAVSYQSGRLEISKDGAAIVADTSFTFPSGMTRLDLLGDHAGANAPTTACLKWLRYYPSAYIGASLQQLSSMT